MSIDLTWPLIKDSSKTVIIEPVKSVRVRVANRRNVVEIFTYLIKEYHERVDDLTKPHPADDWGWNYRVNVNNPKVFSRHARGIAVDLDATEHPNGVKIEKTFTATQIKEIRKILIELGGVIRWGGDYKNVVDGMHFEINVRRGKIRRVARKIRRGTIKKVV